jgi:CubicO group peptidase (beta-lactamase class C family)
MNPTLRSHLFSITLLLLWNAFAYGDDRPISGKKVPGYEPIDKVVSDFMDTIGCQAGTVAISKNARQYYSRGYGWLDESKSKPIPPDALMRIATVTNSITAAMIKSRLRARQLTLTTKAFDFIGLKPQEGKEVDSRISKITIGQLLEHKGGWDMEVAYDPMFRGKQIEKDLGLSKPATPMNVVEYMMTQPLQFNPGQKMSYSNFGYCVLGRVIEKALDKPYSECVQQVICKPLKINDIKLGYAASNKRDIREVWYPVADDAFPFDVMDSHGGLIASAPALCQYLHAYWISGEPRQSGQIQSWTFIGSFPGTTALVRQRIDGVNVAILFNGRREKYIKEDIETLTQGIDKAIDEVIKGK